ncbi:MAG: hypothetical protein JXN60_01410 [Lentisphaerae bacterium]|nr:hypothetical protein [Lentisphaerota bacterium]
MARKMCAATKAFEPEVLWVLAELGTVSVGYHLHNMMGLPIHATVYDAHETARWHLPSLYYPWYIRSVDRFFSELASFDAISEEMAQYLKTRYPNLTNVDEAICQPFVVSGYCASSPSSPWELNDCTKRIAFCGTNRMNSEQWQAFLDALGKLPNKFEIVAFAYKDSFPQAGVFPSNVSATFLPFMDSEAQIIEKFLSLRVHAGYLGLWKDPKRLLFGNTSLSAKLTTYAAAGCPVIVDATESSVAWRLVKKYHAGVLFNGQTDDLKLLFENREEWLRMANGSIEMCRNEFNVDKNVAPLRKMLEKISKIKVSKTNPS